MSTELKPTLTDFVAANDSRDPVKLAPSFRDIGTKRDSDTLIEETRDTCQPGTEQPCRVPETGQ